MKRLGILDTDERSLEAAGAWLNTYAPNYVVTIQAASWGKFLTDSSFPPDIVVLRYRPTDRVDIAYETRVCRILDLEVLVMIEESDLVLPPGPERGGAIIVSGLEGAVNILGGASA